ncbi:MAG: T9SS type A sorting domain-containing protein, partial [Saprospiraceae bacterium]
PDRNFSSGKQYGFIAQEVAEVVPELALLNSDGYYAVNYTMLIPVLTEAIKEQDATISALQTELSELRRTVADLKADRAGQNTEGFRLEQNAPNPFSNSTVIGYALPSGTNGAVISVYDLTGRTLRSFNLSDGEGQITLNAGDLPEGLYIYDLQVNGRQVLERKMSVARK